MSRVTPNVFRTDHRAEVWLRVGALSRDCEITFPRSIPSIGVFPEWLGREIDCLGWNGLLGEDCLDLDLPGEAGWALRHGLCPGQLFKIRVHCRWYRCGGYDGEECSDHDVEIIDREPIAPAEAARRWAKLLEE